MGTKYEYLSRKSSEIIEEKKSVNKLADANTADRNIVKKLLDNPLLDNDDNASIYDLDDKLISDSKAISRRIEENNDSRMDTLTDVDSMMEGLKSNLKKIEEIRATSDLATVSSQSEKIISRVKDLKRIKELLEGKDSSDDFAEGNLVAEISFFEEKTNEFKEGLKAANVETVKHDYALGILATNVNFTQEYKSILKERYSSAERTAQEVFDLAVQSKMLYIANGMLNREQGGAHYNPINNKEKKRGIYYNASADELDFKGKGKGTTFFHEIGHMIDHLFGGDIFFSSSDDFLDALKDDLVHIKEKMDSDAVWGRKFMKMINSDSTAHSISDILEGLTNGSLCGRFGHIVGDFDYWTKDKYRICNESFAHFFEASMGEPEKLRRLRVCFPKAYCKFKFMLENIAKKSDTKIREREIEKWI